jgi:hypothetical protein
MTIPAVVAMRSALSPAASAIPTGLLSLASRAALLLPIASLLVPAPVVAKDPPMPTMEELRQLQLRTLDCGRENLPEPCRQARDQADPLLDHPRLGGSCKDALWTIREQATVAPSNSFERRQRLNRAGTDITIFCRPQTQPVRPSSDNKKDGGGSRPRGFGLIPNS